MACTEAEIALPVPGGEDTEKGVPLSIRNLGLSLEVESRSVVTGGPGEEEKNPNPLASVGICVTKQNGSGAVSFYVSSVKSQLFTYNEAIPLPAWELAEGEEPLCLYTEKGTVYAYAPSGKSVSLSGTPKVPSMSGVRVLDKQKFSFNDGGKQVDAATDVQWETDQDDYLYCMAADQVDRWHPEVSLLMQHALAKVSFRVLEAEGGTAFSGCRVARVTLKSDVGLKKSTSARLNLSTGVLEGTMTDAGELVFTADGDLRGVGSGEADASKVAIQAFGLVIPVTDVGVTLVLTLEDGRTFNMKPAEGNGKAPGTFTADWKKGYNYIYNIRLQPQGIELADIRVAGWNDGGAHDIPVE
ncbi:hypothetical protein GCM10007084_10210 [Parabacteroides faecis]|nr:hypothetical protein GCM10007084_10210 [Parabacteroides faecis]